MKRIISAFLTMLLTMCCASPALAVDTEQSEVVDGELTIETITIGNEIIEIPVVTTTEKSTYSTYSGQSLTAVEESSTFYIPITEEGLKYNEDYIESIKALGTSLSTSDQFLDPKKYYKLTSTINYSIYDSADGKEKDWLIGIDSISISHSQDPVGMDWDIYDIDDPRAVIYQNGLCEGHDKDEENPDKKDHWKGGQVTQEQPVTFRWGASVYTPSDWCPIIRGSAPYVYTCGVQYTLRFRYSDGWQECNPVHLLN